MAAASTSTPGGSQDQQMGWTQAPFKQLFWDLGCVWEFAGAL